VTGAGGFIGRGIVPALVEAGYAVRTATREPADMPPGIESAVIGDLRRPMNLAEALYGVDAVVHAAGIAHAAPGVSEADYKAVNTDATAALAKAARQAGVKRFVLLSSVRAQSGPTANEILTEDMPPQPTDAYGRSKRAAEQKLAESGADFTILRPVLVHGPGMRLNMAALMKLADTRWPLPLGGFHARRSILAREHLADAILMAIERPAFSGQTFLVADPEALSVREMIAAIRSARGRWSGLFPVPVPAVSWAAGILGRGPELERLRQPLVVNPARLLAAGWRPRRSAAEALRETARAYG
jgi:UDP-glucose 4-epimerase